MFDRRPELANTPTLTNLVNDSYNRWGDASSFGPKPRKSVQKYESYRSWNGGGVQFRLETMEEEESGVCSPPLWRNSTTSPPISPVQSRHLPNNYRNLSPTSRAQAIARGQWELMEMVRKMPESSYELSLKDLVEHQHSVEEEGSTVEERSILGNDDQILSQRWKVKRQESKKKRKIMRNGSIDQNRGLLLNMVFPFSFGSKKKKGGSVTNSWAKVSPKPEVLERDWWKRRFSVTGESESGVTSSSSGSTRRSGSTGSSGSSGGGSTRSNSSRKNSDRIPGCWSFFHFKNRHTA